jgi:hypothetical protein
VIIFGNFSTTRYVVFNALRTYPYGLSAVKAAGGGPDIYGSECTSCVKQ